MPLPQPFRLERWYAKQEGLAVLLDGLTRFH